jgi:hypothetical protein
MGQELCQAFGDGRRMWMQFVELDFDQTIVLRNR